MSSSSSTSSLVSIATFSGSSSYASSFQQVLTRAVQIASLPGLELESTISTLENQESAASSLETTFSTLQSAIESVNTATQGSSYASVSDTSILTATASSSASAGSYTITVDDVGSAATAMSSAGSTTVTDPSSGSISSSTSFSLVVNGTTTTITPSGTTLDDLASAINSSGAGVDATVVNVGGSSGADYRLALTSSTMGAKTIELDDSSGTALTSQETNGSAVKYKINGGTTDIESDTRTITLATGLSVKLVSADSSTAVTITVSKSTSGLSSALSTLATDYNSAVSAIAAQTGSSGGALTGDAIISGLRNMLSSLLHYSNSTGSIANLNSLGLEVDSSGSMTFNSTSFDNLSTSDIESFLGSTSSGGFLETAYDTLDSYTNSDTGVLYGALSTLETSITNDNNKLSDDEDQVSTLQTNLLSRLSKADAAIATLESEKNYYKELFQAEYTSSS